MICANIHNSTQVHIPRNKSSQNFVFKMKCEATSDTTHDVLIGKEIGYKSYKEICSGEPKKVNLGFNNYPGTLKVVNNTLLPLPPRRLYNYIHGRDSRMPLHWEVLSTFFSNYNIEPNWVDCNGTYGWYEEELGGFTGCIGKV